MWRQVIAWLNQEITRLQLTGTGTWSGGMEFLGAEPPGADSRVESGTTGFSADDPYQYQGARGKNFDKMSRVSVERRSPDSVTSSIEYQRLRGSTRIHSKGADADIGGINKIAGLGGTRYDWQRPDFGLEPLVPHSNYR